MCFLFLYLDIYIYIYNIIDIYIYIIILQYHHSPSFPLSFLARASHLSPGISKLRRCHLQCLHQSCCCSLRLSNSWRPRGCYPVLGAAWRLECQGFTPKKHDWLLVHLPLWKIWVRQLGWWNSHILWKDMESHKFHGSSHHQPDEFLLVLGLRSFRKLGAARIC